MRVKVRLFARLQEIAGAGELVREVGAEASVGSVWNALTHEFPALAPYTASIASAVNAEYSRFDAAIREDDEVAFLPPVSGGSGPCSTS